jgi:hypothetical protein
MAFHSIWVWSDTKANGLVFFDLSRHALLLSAFQLHFTIGLGRGEVMVHWDNRE